MGLESAAKIPFTLMIVKDVIKADKTVSFFYSMKNTVNNSVWFSSSEEDIFEATWIFWSHYLK